MKYNYLNGVQKSMSKKVTAVLASLILLVTPLFNTVSALLPEQANAVNTTQTTNVAPYPVNTYNNFDSNSAEINLAGADPVIGATSPTNGAEIVIGSPQTLSVVVTDPDNDIKSVTWKTSGTYEVASDEVEQSTGVVFARSGNTWSGTYPTATSIPGDYTLTFIAKDNAGNAVEKSASITLKESNPSPVCTYDFTAQKMWEVTWGYGFEDRNGGTPKFTPQSNGGIETINGSPTTWNSPHLYVTNRGSTVNQSYRNTYGFKDGTVRTVNVSWSNVNGCQTPNIVWAQSFRALDDFPSTNSENKINNHQYVEQTTTASGKVALKFVNPTNKAQYFEVRSDDAASTSTGKYSPCRMGITPLSSSCNGKRYLSADDLSYPSVAVAANSTVNKTYAVSDNVAVRVTFGPERNWDFDWTAFIPHDQPKQVTLVAPTTPVKHRAPTTVKWATNDTNIKEFIYQRFENDTCSSAAAHTKGGLTAKSYTDPTLATENFSWHVKAISNDPLSAQGPWSECFKVTVDKIQPTQVQLTSPANNAFVNGKNGVKHTWTSTDDDVQEFIYISTFDEAGTQRRSSKGGSAASEYVDMTPTQDGDVYYWMVKTTDKAGNQGPWSEKRKVTIVNTAPGLATNPTPANNTLLNFATLKTSGFVWTPPVDDGSISYEYQVSISNNSSNLSPDGSFITTVPNYNGAGRSGNSTPTPDNTLVDGDYYWHVRYTDAAGNVGAWTEAFKFTVDNTESSNGNESNEGNAPVDGGSSENEEQTTPNNGSGQGNTSGSPVAPSSQPSRFAANSIPTTTSRIGLTPARGFGLINSGATDGTPTGAPADAQTPTDTNTDVLGANDFAKTDSDSDVLGQSDNAKDGSAYELFGIAWYWIVAAAAALLFAGWWFLAAKRRKKADNSV